MKKITLILALFLAMGVAGAQSSNITNAFNSLRKGNLVKAKNYIDLASEHEDTKDLSKTWFYKGNIYFAIAISTDKEIFDMDTNALTKAKEFYDKALNLDPTISNDMLGIPNPELGIAYVAEEWAKRGIKFSNKREYYNAYLCYEKAFKFRKTENLYNYFKAMSAYNFEQTKNPKKDTISLLKDAKVAFNELISSKYKNEQIYDILTRIYMEENDTLKALSIAKKAEQAFPDSISSLLVKCNVFYWANKGAEATATLEKVKSIAPNNGLVFTKIGSILEKSNFEEAEKAYIKAKDLDPKNFIAMFNLGALYFNKFADLKKIASNTRDEAEYTKKMEEVNKYLALALPVVEQCYAMDPKDKPTVFMLKQIYANSKEYEKAKKMDEILKTLP